LSALHFFRRPDLTKRFAVISENLGSGPVIGVIILIVIVLVIVGIGVFARSKGVLCFAGEER
jgi:hypothetical protein